MTQIQLQATGGLDDLTHLKIFKIQNFFPTMLAIFYYPCYTLRYTNILLNHNIKSNLRYFQ